MDGRRLMCVGLVCVDIVSAVKEFPEEDSDHRGVEQRWQCGGNASNSCTALALLGAACHFVGSVADAPEKLFIENNFKKYGIETSIVYHKHCSTAVTVAIINAQNGSRTLLHGGGGIPEITIDDFMKIEITPETFSWIHFEARPTAFEDTCKMLERVDKVNEENEPAKRIATSVELEQPYSEQSIFYGTSDYIFIGKDYAKYLGFETKEKVAENYWTFCKKSRDTTLICAWGEHGAIARTPDGSTHSAQASAPQGVIDTLGAGDCFNAATILALSEKKSIKEAIEYGCEVAGVKCGMQGYGGLATFNKCQ